MLLEGESTEPKTPWEWLHRILTGDTYMEYLNIPYIIFVRDTMSYFALLGLLFTMCLSPSTVEFSGVEGLICVFFLARFLMEMEQFYAGMRAEKDPPKKENAFMGKLSNYFRDQWNVLDFITLIVYIATFILRMITWGVSVSVVDDRLLAVAFDLYGLIAMLLTFRAFGHVMEGMRCTGTIQIALVYILRDVVTIFWQFVAMTLAFSFIISRIYTSERSYAPATRNTEGLFCKSAGLYCWWSIAKHLVWSVLGIENWEKLITEDSVSESLVHLLYGLFLIMGAIVLVNMMIALLSNTYQSVQENSLREWSFKKALTIQTYSFYHPVPVPFNLVSIPAVALYKLCKRKRESKIENSDSTKEKEWVTWTRKYVTAQYFATYGDSFPLTDEQKKIDRILHQTSGNEAGGKKIDRILYETSRVRLMTADFTKKVFRQRGYREGEFKTGESAWTSPGIKIEGNILTHQGPEPEVCGERTASHGWREIRHGARYFTPFTREMPRMEVFIQEIGESQEVGVGAVFEGYDHHWMPGWKDGSVGYHSDDGKIYENSGKGRECGDILAYRGDLITCEVDFDREENGVIPVIFLFNDKEMCSSKAKRAELPAAEEPSHTDMLKKQNGSIEEQMGFIREQLMSTRKEMKIMAKDMSAKMGNMEKNIKREMEEQRKLLLQLMNQEKNT